MTQARIGALAAAGAAILFGSAFVATAVALRSFGPLPIAFWRGLIAAILVGGALRAGLLGSGANLATTRDGRGRATVGTADPSTLPQRTCSQ